MEQGTFDKWLNDDAHWVKCDRCGKSFGDEEEYKAHEGNCSPNKHEKQRMCVETTLEQYGIKE